MKQYEHIFFSFDLETDAINTIREHELNGFKVCGVTSYGTVIMVRERPPGVNPW